MDDEIELYQGATPYTVAAEAIRSALTMLNVTGNVDPNALFDTFCVAIAAVIEGDPDAVPATFETSASNAKDAIMAHAKMLHGARADGKSWMQMIADDLNQGKSPGTH